MPFTDYTDTGVLGHLFGSTTLPKPAGLWLGLFTAAPSAAGTGGTEVATAGGTGYVRRPATFAVSGARPAKATLAAEVVWPVAAARWGVVVAMGVFDAAAGGTLLDWVTPDETRLISVDDAYRVPAGRYTITLD